MPGRKHALLIGIASYEQLRRSDLGLPLEGCVNDVQRLYSLLVARDFRIRFLLDQRATRGGILGAMDRLIGDAAPGDAVLLCFSGAGSRVRAEGWPRWYRTIVPYDSARESSDYPNLDIFDLEIDGWAERLERKGVHATLILDTCPSGIPDAERRANRSVVPDERTQAEMLGDEDEARLPATLIEALRTPALGAETWGWVRPGRQTAVLAACDTTGVATETLGDNGIPHGRFTHCLIRVLEERYAQTPWPELDWRKILAAVRDGEIAKASPGQVPRLDGFERGLADRRASIDETPEMLAGDTAPTTEQHALLIGVGRYPYVPKDYGRPLKGPLNDVQRLYEVLLGRGFHIRILLDHYATRERILAAVEDLYDVGENATVFIHHSGHGDRLEGKHWRRHFQTLVPFDSGRKGLGPNRDIFDTEIDLWIKHLNRKTPHVILTFDSCHSGDVSRGTGDDVVRSLQRRDPRPREEIFGGETPTGIDKMPPELAGTRAASEPRAPSGWLSVRDRDDRRAMVFSACRSAENAAESTKGDGATYGRFTHALTEVLTEIWRREEVATTAWKDLPWLEIRDQVAGRVTADNSTQHPTVDGLGPVPPATELVKHAVLIGINDYRRRPLKTPVQDTTVLAKDLEDHHRYDSVDLLQDARATLQGIRDFFSGFQKLRNIGPDSAVLIYFAGHGEAEGDALGSFEGSLLPQDADFKDRRTWLKMTELRDILDGLRCRHLLLVLDCCFAGAFAFNHRGGARNRRLYRSQIDRYLRSHAWQLLTSASHNQLARDVDTKTLDNNIHSPFAAAFLKGLRGDADAFDDGVITATDLFQHLETELETVPGGQTPGLAPLTPESTGQFIFRNPLKKAFDPLPDPVLDPSRVPWRGLEPYGREHHALLFGRHATIEKLLELLRTLGPEEDGGEGASRVLAVVGASGTGKSSLVRAGLLPRLSPTTERPTEETPCRWTIHEVSRLGEKPEEALTELPDDGGRGLLFIDQFEELYTRCSSRKARQSFRRLLRLRMAAGDQVVITLRSDFQSRAAADLGKAFLPHRVPEPELDQLREVIEGPAEETAVFFAPGLVDKMIEEVRHTPWPLPLLSVTLSDMYAHAWQRWQETADREIRLEDYPAGGVAGVLRERATALYDASDLAKQATIRRVFLRLVSLEGGHRTRRRVAEKELEFTEGWKRVDEVLAEWTEKRFLVRHQPEARKGMGVDRRYVEPANNALIQAWKMVDRWLDESGDLIQLLRDLWRAAQAWEQAADKHKHGLLWHDDPRLYRLRVKSPGRKEAKSLPELNRLEARFVEASFALLEDELEQEKIRRRRAEELLFEAEAARKAEAEARRQAEENRRRADRERQRAHIALARTEVQEARRAATAGRWSQGLAHAARAVKLAPGNSAVRGLAIEMLLDKSPLQTLDKEILGTVSLTAHPARDAASGRPPGMRLHHGGDVHSAAFSPDGRQVATASSDRTCRLWDTATGRPAAESMRHDNAVIFTAFSPGGRRLLAVAGTTAQIWDTATAKPLGAPLHHEDSVRTASFSADGRRVVTSSADGTARIWDAATGKPLGVPLRHRSAVSSATFRPDGKQILTASMDTTAQVWDAVSGAPVGEPLEHEGAVYRAAFSPSGFRVVTASADHKGRIWDAPDSPARQSGTWSMSRLEHQGAVCFATFSPDGHQVLTASMDATARLWDDRTGEPMGEPLRHQQAVLTGSFSPDSQRVVTASIDGTARIWDSATGSPVTPPLRHHDGLRSAAFSPDGQRVVTASMDGTARIWDLPVGSDTDSDLLVELAEVIAGHFIYDLGGIAVLPQHKRSDKLAELLRIGSLARANEPTIAGLVRWYFAHPWERTFSPLSAVKVEEYIRRLLNLGTDEAREDAKSAFPGHPLLGDIR